VADNEIVDVAAPAALMRIWAAHVKKHEWAIVQDAGHAGIGEHRLRPCERASRKSQIARSSGSSRTPCRSSSRSAKLICRATAQLSEPRSAGRRPSPPLPIQQRTTLAGCSVWRRIISQ
jgi:hypothetical protein